MTIINLFLISVICVLIIDLSGFIDSLKYGLSKLLTKNKLASIDYRLKPIDCSLCMSFWISLIYILCIGLFSIPMLALILFFSILTPVTKDVINLIKDMLIFIMNKIYDKMQ